MSETASTYRNITYRLVLEPRQAKKLAGLAQRTVVLENLKVEVMTRSAKGTIESPGTNLKQKSGLNREILERIGAG